jgi:hypothetical protein
MNSGLPGVDVMITIFYDFCQFSAKKMPFFSNANVMINFLQKLAVIWEKTQIFRQIFRQKYLKNHNIGHRVGDFFAVTWKLQKYVHIYVSFFIQWLNFYIT